MNDDEIQNNIDQFVEEHGVEGFFRLYLRKYLFELLNEEVHAATNDPDADSALQLHFSRNVTTDAELAAFEDQLRAQCAERADELVQRIKASDDLRPLFEDADIELLQEDTVEGLIRDAMHDIIEEWDEEDAV